MNKKTKKNIELVQKYHLQNCLLVLLLAKVSLCNFVRLCKFDTYLKELDLNIITSACKFIKNNVISLFKYREFLFN